MIQFKSSKPIFLIAILCIESYSMGQHIYPVQILQPDPIQIPSICMVMTDPETEKNMVIWEKAYDPVIERYQVWKVTGTDYSLVSDRMETDTAVILDWNSKPRTKTDAYVLVSIDSCGNASEKSEWHKPFFLQSNIGLNDVINLNWQPYLVDNNEFIFKSIIIYRGTDSTELVAIDTVSAGIGSTSYTDEDPPLNVNVYYRIGGEKETPCDPNNLLGKKGKGGPYVHSLSNLEDNRLGNTGLASTTRSNSLRIYPNPFKKDTKLSWNNPEGKSFDLYLYDLKGTLIRIEYGLVSEEFVLKRNTLSSGYYLIELRGEKLFHGRLMVE